MASGGDTGGSGGTRGHGAVGPDADAACRNLGVESGSRKRKTIESLEAVCQDFQRISVDIENLRSQLDENVKECGYYCEENEKLMAVMDLKNKEIQCLRKQNEELQAMYKDLRVQFEKQNEERDTGVRMWNCKSSMQASNTILQLLETQIDAKRKQLQQFKELYSTMKYPWVQLEEGKRIPDK